MLGSFPHHRRELRDRVIPPPPPGEQSFLTLANKPRSSAITITPAIVFPPSTIVVLGPSMETGPSSNDTAFVVAVSDDLTAAANAFDSSYTSDHDAAQVCGSQCTPDDL